MAGNVGSRKPSAAGAEKGLWFSRTRAEDRRLVLGESAIDALSYAALFPDAEAGQTVGQTI